MPYFVQHQASILCIFRSMLRQLEKLHQKHKLTQKDTYFKYNGFNHSSSNSILFFMAGTCSETLHTYEQLICSDLYLTGMDWKFTTRWVLGDHHNNKTLCRTCNLFRKVWYCLRWHAFKNILNMWLGKIVDDIAECVFQDILIQYKTSLRLRCIILQPFQ